MHQFAGAVVKTISGKILCQLRDDDPNIICPGMWCCTPGGLIEEGEKPDIAILRELDEEFEIQVSNLKLLMLHKEESEEYRGIYYLFAANLQTPISHVKCNEGQRVAFFDTEEAIKLPQHPVGLLFLDNYIKSLNCK